MPFNIHKGQINHNINSHNKACELGIALPSQSAHDTWLQHVFLISHDKHTPCTHPQPPSSNPYWLFQYQMWLCAVEVIFSNYTSSVFRLTISGGTSLHSDTSAPFSAGCNLKSHRAVWDTIVFLQLLSIEITSGLFCCLPLCLSLLMTARTLPWRACAGPWMNAL